jgi:uncharacterized protein DUF3618
MSTTPNTGSDPDAIREEIEQTRSDLADTVDALQYKMDVKARAKERARATGAGLRERGVELKDQATTSEGKPRPELLAGAAVVLALVVAVVWWRRR